MAACAAALLCSPAPTQLTPCSPSPLCSPAGSAVNVPGSQEWCGWGRTAGHTLAVNLAGCHLVLQRPTGHHTALAPIPALQRHVRAWLFHRQRWPVHLHGLPCGPDHCCQRRERRHRMHWMPARHLARRHRHRQQVPEVGAWHAWIWIGWLLGCVCKPVAARSAARPELPQQDDAT